MDSGVIRHLKLKLRKRLRKENGGRRQVLEKEKMYKILCEVWDSIPLDELRPYMLKTAERWKEIKKRKGKWVGWSKSNKESSRRHGMTE
jgi:hypothetical protein